MCGKPVDPFLAQGVYDGVKALELHQGKLDIHRGKAVRHA